MAGAQDPVIRVSSNAHFPLLIDGEEIVGSATAELGSQACVTTSIGNTSEVERLTFQGWSHGPKGLCVILDEPGEFTALYQREVLLTINSQVKAFRESKWVPQGSPSLLSVPEEVVEQPGIRFLFDEWSGGEARFSSQNRIVPNRPLTLEVFWFKEFFLEITGPAGVELVGGGWHRAGDNVVLKADMTAFSLGEDERHEFSSWEVISNPAVIIPNRQQPITSIRMDDTHIIEAKYVLAYRVVAKNELREIVNDFFTVGKDVPLDTEPTIELDPGKERLTFNRWEGVELDTPKGSVVVVNEPLIIEAIYDREFKVTVESPYGVTFGDDWYSEGEVANIKVPQNPSALFFLNRSFKGFDGHSTEGPTLNLIVTGPLTVTATYTTSVDIKILIIALLVLAALGVVYFFSQREYTRRRRTRW